MLFLRKARFWKERDNLVEAFPWEKEIEAKDWKDRIREEPDLKKYILRDWTKDFIAFLDASLEPERSFGLMICGGLGGGKSYITEWIAWHGREKCPESDTKITAGSGEMRIAIETAPPHSTVCNDEDVEDEGIGSDIVERRLRNDLRLIREGGRNVILSAKYFDPELTKIVKFINFYIEPWSFNPESKENRAIIRNNHGKCRGHIILKYNAPDWFHEEFRAKKRAIHEQLDINGGKISPFNLKEMRQKVKTFIQNEGSEIPSKSDLVEMMDMEDEYPELFVLHIPDILKMKIARQAIILCKRDAEMNPSSETEASQEEKEQGSSKQTKDHILIKTNERPDYLEALEAGLKVRGIPYYKIRTFHLKATSKEGNDDVARLLKQEGLPGSTGSVSNWMKEIQKKHIGYVFENVIDAELTRDGIPHEKGGGNKDDIDEIIFEDGAKQIPKAIWSLKCYANLDIFKAISEVNKNERTYAQEHGIPCLCVAYEYFTQILKVFELTFSSHQLINQADFCESRNDGSLPTPSFLSGGTGVREAGSPERQGALERVKAMLIEHFERRVAEMAAGRDAGAASAPQIAKVATEVGGGQGKIESPKKKKRRRHS
jgi:hypothetical protein